MKSSMRQWPKLVLVGMLIWVILFFTLLTYFLDAHGNEPLASAGSLLSQHPDTRRLASVQHLQHAGPGPRPDPAPTSTNSAEPPAGPTAAGGSATPPELGPSAAPRAYENYLDPQSLAAWSSFGTENVGSHSAPAGQSRERGSLAAEYHSQAALEEEEGEEGGEGGQEGGEEEAANDGREREDEEEDGGGGGRRTTASRRAGPDSSHLDVAALSKLSVLQRLWRGRGLSRTHGKAPANLVNQVKGNQHGVSYTGSRRSDRSARELLCQMKEQARLRTLDGTEQPFSTMGWARLVPSVPLESVARGAGRSHFRTCAVVSSAGSILRSGLGPEIGE